jgi:glycerol-3-phosphate dehydrogenase (NAD(P)+)
VGNPVEPRHQAQGTLRVAVLGAGSWGTTVATLTSRKALTTLWARDPDVAREIREQHSNERYLPGWKLPEALQATDSMEVALRGADVLVAGVPCSGLRATLLDAKKFLRPRVPVVSLAKGLEEKTQLRMTQVIEEVIPGHPAGALTGPNLAREIMAGFAATSVVAMSDPQLARQLQGVFHTGTFRVYTNPDVIGCELGGALKNVIAIAAGMADGLGVGDNTRAAVITRGLNEITRLGVAMGAQASTFAGLTGMGDLIATCVSPQSRNRYVGEQLGRGRRTEEILKEMHMVAEGVKSSRVVLQLGERYGIELPITRWVCRVLYDGCTAAEAYRGLRPRSEMESD